ncbi:hypothetical protein PPEP_b0393 [Pseudoalteromonas peptidolytica F12-50-A1]|uniref:Uncharacterized protein n=1 Tax=Pseudoalteromonas peptidolytica F12-50-A1 TaxID=1315280 RepID=A0A8I0MZ49_9GAMM|nr:hypothetical protein [Pseudoalteromonas peptidolytica F12-50-A1]NLR15772.1 hypothetical protein [Pseudoalteromonas peptidolytica]
MSITRKKFCYLVVLNKKFLTLLASDLLLQIEQVLSQIGISCNQVLTKHEAKSITNQLLTLLVHHPKK